MEGQLNLRLPSIYILNIFVLFRFRVAQLVPAWQPGCEKMEREWENEEEMERERGNGDEMERDLLSTFPYFLFKASLSIHFPSWSVSSQEEGKIILHQMVGDWKEEPKSFVGPLSALD